MLEDDDLIVGTKTVVRPIWRWLFVGVILGTIIGSAGGFIWFAGQKAVATPDSTLIPRADGIVVLTGGQARIENSFDLVLHDKANRLLISGVGLCITKEGVRQFVGGDVSDRAVERFNCCVDIDREAHDTFGNAEATRAWAAEKGYDEIVIVTNAFHMVRTMLIFEQAMPDVKLTAYPVVPQAFTGVEWWQDRGIARALAREYAKTLLTWVEIKKRIIMGD